MSTLRRLQQEVQRARQSGRRATARPRPARAVSASVRSPYSAPFYDTGEHVLTGEDLPDLDTFDVVTRHFLDTVSYRVGKPDGGGQRVGFSYGEIIAIADMFESFDQMDAASHVELSRIRTLIRKSRDHYHRKISGKSRGGDGISPGQWQAATGDRYLELAIDNFAHFAPSDPSLAATAAGSRPDHESTWQAYHSSALATVRDDPTDLGLERALAVNAFGDHFLTDAFAAGHLFNKHDVASLFKSKILDATGAINAAGQAFFEAVAKASFVGQVKDTFSDHETVERMWGVWRPNINSASRFARFLMGIQEAEPDLIGKTLVAKIIHDELNDHAGGVAVENRLGDAWRLTGDGTLNLKNLAMIRKAVSRSIFNVANEADSGRAMPELVDRVWDLAPAPTSASRSLIAGLVRTYTDPGRAELRQAAAREIRDNYRALLDQAVARGALKKA